MMVSREQQIDALRATLNQLEQDISLKPRYTGIYSRRDRDALKRERDEVQRELYQLECEESNRLESEWDAHVAERQRMHDEQLDSEAEEAEYRAYEREG